MAATRKTEPTINTKALHSENRPIKVAEDKLFEML